MEPVAGKGQLPIPEIPPFLADVYSFGIDDTQCWGVYKEIDSS